MSLYILDTDTLQLFQDEHPLVVVRVEAIAQKDLAMRLRFVVRQRFVPGAAAIRRAK